MKLARGQSGAQMRGAGPSTARKLSVRASAQPVAAGSPTEAGRRSLLLGGVTLTLGAVQQLARAPPAPAIDGNPFKKEIKKRRRKIPDGDYRDGPEGLRYYDLVEGKGAEAKVGERVAVHYDIKFRNITLATTRVGMGVTGGNPEGFNVGLAPGTPGSIFLKGIDLGVRGMHVGGVRRLMVPPELGFGDRQAGELPPNSTIEVDVELLSIKSSRVL